MTKLKQTFDLAVANMVTGREGLSTLSTNRELSTRKVIELYRARGQVEIAFRDLKQDRLETGQIRSKTAIKGRILIFFLAFSVCR